MKNLFGCIVISWSYLSVIFLVGIPCSRLSQSIFSQDCYFFVAHHGVVDKQFFLIFISINDKRIVVFILAVGKLICDYRPLNLPLQVGCQHLYVIRVRFHLVECSCTLRFYSIFPFVIRVITFIDILFIRLFQIFVTFRLVLFNVFTVSP